MSLLLLFPSAAATITASIAVTTPVSVVALTAEEKFPTAIAVTTPLTQVAATVEERFVASLGVTSPLSTVAMTATSDTEGEAEPPAPPVSSGGGGRRRGRMGRAWRLPTVTPAALQVELQVTSPMVRVSAEVTMTPPAPAVVEIGVTAPLSRVQVAAKVLHLPVAAPAAPSRTVPAPTPAVVRPTTQAPSPTVPPASYTGQVAVRMPFSRVAVAVGVTPPAIAAEAAVVVPFTRVQLAMTTTAPKADGIDPPPRRLTNRQLLMIALLEAA